MLNRSDNYPNQASIYALLGDFYQLSGATDKARQSYKHALELAPELIYGYRQISAIYIAENNTAAAIGMIKQGINTNPESAELRLILAGLPEESRQFDKARTEYETLL